MLDLDLELWSALVQVVHAKTGMHRLDVSRLIDLGWYQWAYA